MSVLEDILADSEKAAKFLDPILSALSVVVAASGLGAPANEVLAVIRAAVEALEHAASGKATIEETNMRIGALTDIIDTHNRDADAALAARFPVSP